VNEDLPRQQSSQHSGAPQAQQQAGADHAHIKHVNTIIEKVGTQYRLPDPSHEESSAFPSSPPSSYEQFMRSTDNNNSQPDLSSLSSFGSNIKKHRKDIVVKVALKDQAEGLNQVPNKTSLKFLGAQNCINQDGERLNVLYQRDQDNIMDQSEID